MYETADLNAAEAGKSSLGRPDRMQEATESPKKSLQSVTRMRMTYHTHKRRRETHGRASTAPGEAPRETTCLHPPLPSLVPSTRCQRRSPFRSRHPRLQIQQPRRRCLLPLSFLPPQRRPARLALPAVESPSRNVSSARRCLHNKTAHPRLRCRAGTRWIMPDIRTLCGLQIRAGNFTAPASTASLTA